ncbi:MAG: HPr family phosphocarrier protein [Verrucomicrobiaceae bacterium]|nr:HPr family phosphocarrier protein [Verrucomicrobiaceae bacterium]
MGFLTRKRDPCGSEKVTREFTIVNRLGLHARPSAQFVKLCSRFRCEVLVEKDGEQVNGKSIMGLMMLAAGMGSKLKVTCEGSDCEKALSELAALIHRKFDED